MPSNQISVLINTLNEEKNLPYVLRSVSSWADEILVVDMQSTDRTLEIAQSFDVRVVLHGGPGFGYPPREFGVAQARHEWVLVVDADELIPLSLSKLIKSLVLNNTKDAYWLPRINYLCGAAMSATGWSPDQDAQLRLFRKSKVIASSRAHMDFVPTSDARVERIQYQQGNAIIHFNYIDFEQFLSKLNRYTGIEAQQASERGESTSPARALLRTVLEFFNRYLRRGGYRDGWRGFFLSGLMATYHWTKHAKIVELDKVGKRSQIEQSYQDEAEKWLREYGG